MSYLVLARKWRPKAFSEVIGQHHVLKALINGLDQDRLHHAFLFSGTRGVGKTTLARIFAKSLNCEHGVSSNPCGECQSCKEVDAGRFVDLIEVDAASRTKVDDTRELLENVQYAPSRGRFKVYLIDEVHMLSTSSFNALLKTLEEPPPHVKFLFATTDPQKLPVTVLSRCLQLNLRRLDISQISEHLATILQHESIPFEHKALLDIARAADGSMRDALSILDQAISFCAGSINTENVNQMLGTISQQQLFSVMEALINQDGLLLLQQTQEMSNQGRDFTKAFNDLLTMLQQISTIQLVPELEHPEDIDITQLATFSERLSPELVQLFYQIALHGKRDMPYAADPKSGFDMTLLRMLRFQPQQQVNHKPTTQTSLKTASKHNGSTTNNQMPAKKITTPNGSLQNITDAESVAKLLSPQKNKESATLSASVTTLNTNNWLEIISNLNLTAFARQLADNSAFIDFSDDKITLSINPELAHLASDKAKDRLESALVIHLNQPITIVYQKQKELTTTTTLATERAHQEKADQQQARDAIHNDDAIKAIKDTFNAQIIESTIKPLK